MTHSWPDVAPATSLAPTGKPRWWRFRPGPLSVLLAGIALLTVEWAAIPSSPGIVQRAICIVRGDEPTTAQTLRLQRRARARLRDQPGNTSEATP